MKHTTHLPNKRNCRTCLHRTIARLRDKVWGLERNVDSLRFAVVDKINIILELKRKTT